MLTFLRFRVIWVINGEVFLPPFLFSSKILITNIPLLNNIPMDNNEVKGLKGMGNVASDPFLIWLEKEIVSERINVADSPKGSMVYAKAAQAKITLELAKGQYLSLHTKQ